MDGVFFANLEQKQIAKTSKHDDDELISAVGARVVCLTLYDLN